MQNEVVTIETISTLIANSETFAIITHRRPDGDAISSSLAMFWYLLDIGKKANDIDVIIPEYIDELSFIPGTEHFKRQPTKEKYDLLIIVDCAEERRIKGKEVLKLADKTICFDHHEEKEHYADYNIINANASSCTGLIYDVFPECEEKNYLDCIATGIISDTVNLTLNVTERTKEIIKILEEQGVNVDEISKKLAAKNKRTEELIKIVMERATVVEDSIYCSYILQNDLLDSEKNLNNVNHKLIIQELQKKTTFKSLILLIENDKGEFKCSLRTFNTNVDLNKICVKLKEEGKILKGGGHSYSAGCKAVGSYTEIFELIANEINQEQS